MKIAWSEESWDDYLHWHATDTAVRDKIHDLIRTCRRTPFGGIGKPEPLRGALQGWWSRRITAEHRFVYRVRGSGAEQVLEIAQCRFHY